MALLPLLIHHSRLKVISLWRYQRLYIYPSHTSSGIIVDVSLATILIMFVMLYSKTVSKMSKIVLKND